jgi:hypothetical protein
VKECPFCFRPVDDDVLQCPNCHNAVDMFRTGYFVRPKLSRPKTAFIWIGALLLFATLAAGLYRGCIARDSARVSVRP